MSNTQPTLADKIISRFRAHTDRALTSPHRSSSPDTRPLEDVAFNALTSLLSDIKTDVVAQAREERQAAAKEASADQHYVSVDTSHEGTSTMHYTANGSGIVLKSWEFSPAADKAAVDEVESKADFVDKITTTPSASAMLEGALRASQAFFDIMSKADLTPDERFLETVNDAIAEALIEGFSELLKPALASGGYVSGKPERTYGDSLGRLGYVHTGQNPTHFVDKIRAETPWLLGARINERGRTEVGVDAATTPADIARIFVDCRRWGIKEIEFKEVVRKGSFLCRDQGYAGGWDYAYMSQGNLYTRVVAVLRLGCDSANEQLDAASKGDFVDKI